MNSAIVDFLLKQNFASICCVDETGKPYCFNCFFAFNVQACVLFFKSSTASYHAGLLNNNAFVSGTVQPDKLNKISIKGIQFDATVMDTQQPLVKQSMGAYLKRHPMAMAIPGKIYALQINNIKMTDSAFGFGKKISWSRNELIPVL